MQVSFYELPRTGMGLVRPPGFRSVKQRSGMNSLQLRACVFRYTRRFNLLTYEMRGLEARVAI